MNVEFLDAARVEYRAAVDHYDGESPGLGGEFADEIARTTARIYRIKSDRFDRDVFSPRIPRMNADEGRAAAPFCFAASRFRVRPVRVLATSIRGAHLTLAGGSMMLRIIPRV